MLPKEYIDSWNELCADCKIVESDTTNPTEAWLTKVLINYLKLFGYSVVPTYNEDCVREKRLFLIKLVRYIDHIYKITNNNNTFTYYDLLKPTPKKTAHMLRILLNYLYYCNMFKTGVFKMGTDRLKERQELLEDIRFTVDENIERHKKVEKIQEEVDILSKEIPTEKNELKSLNSAIDHRKRESQQLKEAVIELGTNIDERKAQIRNLKRQIVPDDEGHELQTQLVKLQENITECEQQIRNAEKNLKTHIADNERTQELLKMVESAKSILTNDFVENFNDTFKKLASTEAQFANCKKEEEQLSQIIIRQEKALKSAHEKLTTDETQYDKEKQRRQQAILCKNKECDDLASKADAINDEIHAVEHSINYQQEIQSYIQENVALLMTGYTGKFQIISDIKNSNSFTSQ